jgi:hypothetical protein
VITLTDFDPQVVAKHHITEQTLERVIRYVHLLQGEDAPTLRDIAVGGYYGTSALLHEVVELDILLTRDPGLLRKESSAVQRFFRANLDAHVEAMVVEYDYLQKIIRRLFDEEMAWGALVVANASQEDFELLVESGISKPLFKPKPAEIEQASQLLERLWALGKEMLR